MKIIIPTHPCNFLFELYANDVSVKYLSHILAHNVHCIFITHTLFGVSIKCFNSNGQLLNCYPLSPTLKELNYTQTPYLITFFNSQ